VFGSNFIPVAHMIKCQYFFDTPLIVTGRYVNNFTLECDLPPPPTDITPFNELRIVVEVSLNDGVQYTKDGLVFTYRHNEIMSHMYPLRGFTYGNTYLTIGYQYFYDKSSIRQMCRFSTLDEKHHFTTRIITFDDKFVYCYTPPAYLISENLRYSGGQVRVRISSNNRDFSD